MCVNPLGVKPHGEVNPPAFLWESGGCKHNFQSFSMPLTKARPLILGASKGSDVPPWPPAIFIGQRLRRANLNFIPCAEALCGMCPSLASLVINTSGSESPSHSHCEEPLVLHNLPSLASLVLNCPNDCFELNLELAMLMTFQVVMHRVMGRLKMRCPNLRVWKLTTSAGPPSVAMWDLDLERLHSFTGHMTAVAGAIAEEVPSVVRWLPLFKQPPRLIRLEVWLDASAEHGESPAELRQIYYHSSFPNQTMTKEQYTKRMRQPIALICPPATEVLFFVKQRLTW